MRYHRIDSACMNNGDGIRVVLWLSGCAHKCPGCHNRETWSKSSGEDFTDSVKEHLFNLVENDYIDGITLTGGDPMYKPNREEVITLCRDFKRRFPNKSIWLWTGYDIEDLEIDILSKYIDIIIDGRYIKERPSTKKWRGSDNQNMWLAISNGYKEV
ncbi:MAG: anaerobic ribonucleoside-triphosphate reductase activating protein [Fusobacteriaceae bacterium]